MDSNRNTSPQNPDHPIATNEQALQLKSKMTKKEKTIMWSGIGIVLFVIFFVFIFIILPIIISQVEQCTISFGMKVENSCSSSIGGMMITGGIVAMFIGIPLVLIGLSLVLFPILSWKKVKNPGVTTFLIMLLVALLPPLLLLGFMTLPF